jgi:crotonobetainyl-CoA:carnitine CoA-transferase CaiB-like acyl-CoA transferase
MTEDPDRGAAPDAPGPGGALSGIRVIDAATLAAAPMVATTLAEYGAEVIKVEQPVHGDPLRRWGPQKDGVGLMWKSIGRNKKSVTLDLRQPRGQELLRRLSTRADVIIMNARPSTLTRWGLTYEAFREVNPALVMLHITAFGSGGPHSDRPGFGTMGEAMSGFANLTGQPDGPPTLPPFMLADGVAALAATAAVLVALHHRLVNGGTGQLVDVNLIEPLARLLEHPVLSYDQLGVLAERSGSRWDVSVPRNTYRTADGRWIAMSASSPSIAIRVFQAIGRPDLAGRPEYADTQARMQRADEIDHLVAEWVAARGYADVMAVFTAHDVAAAPIYDARDLLHDEHLRSRGAFIRVPDEDLGAMTVQAPVARLSGTPARASHLGRRLGADTSEVLTTMGGLSKEDVAELQAAGIV